MTLEVALGTSSFRTIREAGDYYVDKSGLISELIATKKNVLLLPRPRRFGKTLNQSMLHCFFDRTQNSGPLFEGLAVAQDPAAMAHLNSYATLFLTFTGMDYLDWTSCEAGLKGKIGQLVGTHLTTLHEAADPVQREMIEQLHTRKADAYVTAQALFLLTELLAKASGKKVVVLIDEYDKLILDGKARGYFPEISSFMRNFLGSALKDNPYLERAVVTGILRIAKESIYSGLNNLTVYSIRDPEFSTCFGFTEAEVLRILSDADLRDKEPGVKAWYNGYSFGKGTTIYNPWSILMFVSRATTPLRAYWINTADNQLIRDLIQNEAVMSYEELGTLLRGGTVSKEIQEDIAFAEMNPNTAWSLMFFTGYLTARTPNRDHASEQTNQTDLAELAIPNLEVGRFFKQTVTSWLGGEPLVQTLVGHLLAERLEKFTQTLAKMVAAILSYHTTGGKNPERVYHVFMLGLLAHLQDRYRVESELETGHGRADLSLIPRKPGRTGFVFEFKASKNQASLEQDAQTALAQIKDRSYQTIMHDADVQSYITIGLAFHQKRIALASQTYEAKTDQPSQPQSYSAGSKQPSPQQEPKPIKKTTKLEAPKTPKREARTRNPSQTKSDEPPAVEDQTQKAVLIGQIHLLQELKGDPKFPQEQLRQLNLHLLEAILTTLKPNQTGSEP